MKNFEIIDDELGISIGILLYYEGSSEFIIELQENLDEWTAPLLLTSFVKKGIFTIPRDISFLWVKERIIPSGRQNIGAILDTHKLKHYDEMKFLEISKGKCSQDNLFIEGIPSLPEYVIERQRRNLLDVSILDAHMLLCFFSDETVKKVDLAKLIDQDGVDKVIQNKALYQSGKIGVGGYAVTFNDSIDIPSWRLYEAGERIPLTVQDFKNYIKNNVLSTGESCEILECSRQNIAYIVKKEQLEPLKIHENGNLYLRGDVEKIRW